jgi:hypothetical protein
LKFYYTEYHFLFTKIYQTLTVFMICDIDQMIEDIESQSHKDILVLANDISHLSLTSNSSTTNYTFEFGQIPALVPIRAKHLDEETHYSNLIRDYQETRDWIIHFTISSNFDEIPGEFIEYCHRIYERNTLYWREISFRGIDIQYGDLSLAMRQKVSSIGTKLVQSIETIEDYKKNYRELFGDIVDSGLGSGSASGNVRKTYSFRKTRDGRLVKKNTADFVKNMLKYTFDFQTEIVDFIEKCRANVPVKRKFVLMKK